jgi:hypothetical protein
MAQSDFTLLAVQCNRYDARREPHVSEIYVSFRIDTAAEQRAKAESLIGASEVSLNIYGAVLHTAHETSLETMEGMDVDTAAILQQVVEPVRRLRSFAPPKRFFRSFWRAAARRLLASLSAQKPWTP